MTTPPPPIPEPSAEDRFNADQLPWLYGEADRSRRNEITPPPSSKTGATYHTPGWCHRDSFHRDAEGIVQSLIRLLHAALADAEKLRAEVARLTSLAESEATCGELSCDDCNDRYAALRAKCEALERAGDATWARICEYCTHETDAEYANWTAAKALTPAATGEGEKGEK